MPQNGKALQLKKLIPYLVLFCATSQLLGYFLFKSPHIFTMVYRKPVDPCGVSGKPASKIRVRGVEAAGPNPVCLRQTPVKFVDSHPWCAGRPGQHLWTVHDTSLPNATTVSAAKPSDSQVTRNDTYFLTAVVMTRIYANDINNFTSNELIQWLQFMSYAGVEHVYLYDAYFYQNESQREAVNCFVKSGFVSYIDWHHKAVDNDRQHRGVATQQPAYQHCLETFGHQFVWQTATDIDEYPYCPSDTGPGFLNRLVHRVLASWEAGITGKRKRKTKARGKLGQIYMQNFLFLGPPPNLAKHPILVDQFWNRTNKVWNRNVKPILLAKGVRRTKVHWNFLLEGYESYYVPTNIVRLNHYQGARYDFDHTYDAKLKRTIMVEDRGMSTVVSMLERCRARCTVGCCI